MLFLDMNDSMKEFVQHCVSERITCHTNTSISSSVALSIPRAKSWDLCLRKTIKKTLLTHQRLHFVIEYTKDAAEEATLA